MLNKTLAEKPGDFVAAVQETCLRVDKRIGNTRFLYHRVFTQTLLELYHQSTFFERHSLNRIANEKKEDFLKGIEELTIIPRLHEIMSNLERQLAEEPPALQVALDTNRRLIEVEQ